MKSVALYGGGFKIPHKGHFTVIKEFMTKYPDLDKYVVLVGAKPRDGITQQNSIDIWNIYNNYLPKNITITPSSAPIGSIIKYIKNNLDDKIYIVLGERANNKGDLEDNENRGTRLKNKYPNVEVSIIKTSNNNISGTNIRKSIQNEDFITFKSFLPEVLSLKNIKNIWEISRNSLNENVTGDQIKYWALYANIFDNLRNNKDKAEQKYNELKDKYKGEQLTALNYFYNKYFKNDE